MKISELKLKDLFEYLLIIVMFYITGGAFSYIHYSLKIILVFALSLFLCLLYRKNIFHNIFTVVIVFALSIFLLLPGIILDVDNISSYIAIVLQLLIGLFCASFIPFKNFKRKFLNVIVFFAAISLVFFAVSLLKPSVALHFVPIDNVEGATVKYYNAYVYVFMEAKGYYSNIILLKRNAGICWEPGCYQMFLNIALIFLLEKKPERYSSFVFKFIVLILTIITTVSTTGYLLMLIIVLARIRHFVPNRKITIPIYLLAVVLFIGFLFTPFGATFLDKLSREFLGGEANRQNVLSRTSIGAIPYIFTDGYFIGMGFSKWVSFNFTMYNSIIHSFLCLGIPFTLLHLVGLFLGSKKITNCWILLFFSIIVCSSTETLFWRIFFNSIAFYGWPELNYVFESYFKKGIKNESIDFWCTDI